MIWEDLIPKLELFNSARTIELFESCTHIYNVRPKVSIGTSPNIEKYKQLKQVHKEVKELVHKGKIDSEYQKDIDIRVRNSPILALWMLGMWLYSLVLKFF